MKLIDYPKLQERYPGLYIALRDEDAVAAEPTYGALMKHLKALQANWSELTIMYVEPPDRVAIY